MPIVLLVVECDIPNYTLAACVLAESNCCCDWDSSHQGFVHQLSLASQRSAERRPGWPHSSWRGRCCPMQVGTVSRAHQARLHLAHPLLYADDQCASFRACPPQPGTPRAAAQSPEPGPAMTGRWCGSAG